ncbi:hypothetical protein BH09PSE1_BH09PSE1_05730 [soil metagenome]
MSELDTSPTGRDRRTDGQLFRIGPFTAKLTPTPLALTLGVPKRLEASLLTRAADTLGRGYTECPRTASCRRPVRLERRAGSKTFIIPHQFAFHLPGSALIQQLGLFDDQGRLRYSGALSSSRQGFERPEEFHFDGGSVEVFHNDQTW